MAQSSYEQDRERREEELERLERLQRSRDLERQRRLPTDLAAGAGLGGAGRDLMGGDENEGGLPWQQDFGALAPDDEEDRERRLDTSRAKDYAEKKIKEHYAEKKAAQKAGEEAAKAGGRAAVSAGGEAAAGEAAGAAAGTAGGAAAGEAAGAAAAGGGAAAGAGAGAAAGGAAGGAAAGAGAAAGTAGGAAAGAPALVVVGIVLLVILVIVLILVLFVGTLVYICNESWKAKAASTVGAWVGILPEDICKAFTVDKGGGGVDADDPASGQVGSFCPREEWAVLAATYKTPVTAQNSTELNRLISCITSDPRLAGQNLGTVYTFEQSNPACNIVRGQSYCGRCSHTVYSCHYGGMNGSQGSEAVDFGLGDGYNAALFDLVEDVARDCGAGFVLDERDHIHISTVNCDRDAGNYSNEGNIGI